MGIEQPGRIRRGLDGLISKAEQAELVRTDEVEPSRHLYVDDQGNALVINQKVPHGQDETLLLLAGGVSVIRSNEDKIPVMPRRH